MQAFLLRLPPPLRYPHLRLLCTAAAPFSISPAQKSHLYIVSTPIGHPGDLTLRAATILRTVSIIAAEDTRRTGLLLSAHDARHSQRMLSCHEHNWRSRVPQLIAALRDGHSVALVSDAGTPCISDPGVQLVAEAVRFGVKVVPVPGACAALTALVASGLQTEGFWFVGFLPRTGNERREMLERVNEFRGCLVLYEAPHRLKMTLEQLRGRRAVCVARELTKKWEEFLRFGSVEEARGYYEETEPRGEFTIILAGVENMEPLEGLEGFTGIRVDLQRLVRDMVREGVPVSSVARCVAGAVDVPKKLVYAFASEVKKSLQEELESEIR